MTSRDPDVFWRRHPTSEGLPPRVMVRAFLPPGDLGASIASYEALQGVEADAVFPYPEVGLRLAVVGAFLLIEGGDAELAPFRATTGTLLVDDVQPWYDRLLADGAEVVVPLRDVPTGRGFNTRHRDGTVVEYVHHRPTPQEASG